MRISKSPHHPATYKCDQCGFIGPWTPSSRFYGSIIQAESNPVSVPTFCSTECMYKWDYSPAKIKPEHI